MNSQTDGQTVTVRCKIDTDKKKILWWIHINKCIRKKYEIK